MPQTTIVCPKCKEELVTEDDVQGASIDCPSCGTSFVVATPASPNPSVAPVRSIPVPPSRPPSSTESPEAADVNKMSSIVRAGWICFGIGAGLMLVLFVFPIWIPLFLATLVLGIIATAKKLKGGVLLLVLSLVVPPVVALFMFLVILGGCAAAVGSEMKKQGVKFPRPPVPHQVSPHSPAPKRPGANR